MPRTEARIFTSIWQDPDFRALTRPVQSMYMFLLSQPDLAHSGVLPLRLGKWAATANGLTIREIQRELDALEDAGFVVIDSETQELLVRSLMRRDKILRQPKMLKPLSVTLLAVESQRLRQVLGTELERAVSEEAVHPTVRAAIPSLLKGLNPQVNTLCHTLSDRVPDTLCHTHPDTHRGSTAPPTNGSPDVLGLTEPSAAVADEPELTAPSTQTRARAVKTDKSRACRIPDDFTVTPAMVDWARTECPNVDGRRETAKFIDYWRSASGPKASKRDWVAAWRYWMRNSADRSGSRQGTLPLAGTGRLSLTDKITMAQDAGRRLQARIDQQQRERNGASSAG